MFTEGIRDAIIALANIDKAATEAEKSRVIVAVCNTRPQGRMVKVKVAAEMLGVHRNTILNWAKSGRLAAVHGADGRVIGVTESSLAAV